MCVLALEVTHRPRQSSGSRGFPLEDVIPGVSYSGLITTHKQTNKQYSCACDSLCHSQFSLKKYYSSWWNWRFRVTTKDFKKKKHFLSLGLAELAKWVHSEGMYLSCPYLIFVRLWYPLSVFIKKHYSSSSGPFSKVHCGTISVANCAPLMDTVTSLRTSLRSGSSCQQKKKSSQDTTPPPPPPPKERLGKIQ